MNTVTRPRNRTKPTTFKAALYLNYNYVVLLTACLLISLPSADAQETIGGGTLASPAVGPAPSFGIGGTGSVLVKNWNFGANGTIKNIADMNGEFVYHDNFGSINNGGNYGAKTVAPDAANAMAGQPIEGVNSPTVRSFLADSLQTYLTPLDGATTVSPSLHNAGNGSFMAKWNLPYGGSWFGNDIVWETRMRYVTPPYFWFAIWTSGNLWDKGAEHDLVESFGYDNGGGNTNYDGRYWHSNAVPAATDAVNYTSWSSGMTSVGITNWDPTVYHVWTLHFKADNTYAFYMDGIKVQYGSAPAPWTFGTSTTPVNLNFLFDGGWGHVGVASVNHSMPASNFTGTFYEWDYSRVYFVPPTAVPPAPDGLTGLPDESSKALVRWKITPYASSYNLYRGTSPGGENATPIATGLKALSYIDTGLSNGVTYYYKVAGVNAVGASALSGEVSVTPVVTYTVDDGDLAPACTYVGTWNFGQTTPGYYGGGYHHDGNAGATGGKRAVFSPTLPTEGYYDVYIRYPSGSNRANNAPVDINHANGSATVTVDQRNDSNTWMFLGHYYFNSGTSGNVTLRDDGANGYVMADAVRWIPSAGTAVVLNPLADAFVRDGSTANSNFGAATTLEAKTGTGSGYTRQSYFKFDLTGITGTVTAAQLNVYGTLSSADTVPVSIYSVADTSWLEAILTWNNKPPMSDLPLVFRTVTNTTGKTLGWDVTSYVGSHVGSDISLALRSTLTNTGALFTGNSWEASANKPQLLLVVVPPGLPAAPTDITAYAGNTRVSLSWTASAAATTYNIKRANVSGGPYATIATGVTGTSYANTGLTNGTAYYYLVSSANAVGEGPNSGQAGAIPQSIAIIKDNADASGITITGVWSASTTTPGYYGANYLNDQNTAATEHKSVKFVPTISVSGYYNVYARWTAFTNRATNTRIDINYAGGAATTHVNQQLNNGQWVLLGTYLFTAGTTGNVEVRNDDANNFVIADAVQFVLN